MRLRLDTIALTGGLQTARAILQRRPGWRLSLTCDGLCGLGEASPLPAFGGEGPSSCHSALLRCVQLIAQQDIEACIPLLQHLPVARNAFFGALLDLQAKQCGHSLAVMLNAGAARRVNCNWLGEQPPSPWRVCKVKASSDPIASAALLRRLHAEDPRRRLRLDANGAWSAPDVRRFAEALGDCPLDLLEQPCPPALDSAMPQLQRSCRLAIAFDESLRSLADAQRLIRLRPAALILKPMLLGGADRCLAIAHRARRAGIRVIVTDSCCGSIGRHHAAHCAAACDPESQEHHGLATAWMQGDDDGIVAGCWQLRQTGIGL